jgi:parvulin-like peptidyl-prolyl isomerase
VAVAAFASLVLSGCGAIRAGAAATVGDQRITTSALDALVKRGLADPTAQQTVGNDRAGFERTVLSRMIQHLILAKAAQSEGVSVDGGTVDAAFDRFATQLGGTQQLQAAALKAGISARDLRGVIADAALRDALGDKLTASIPVPDSALRQAYQQNIAQYDQVHSAHILVASQALAQQVLARVRQDPSSFAALAAQYSQDTSNKGNGGDLGFQGRGALEKPFEKAIFSATPGTFVLAHTIYGWHVIDVIARHTTTFAQATPDLRRTLLSPQRTQLENALLVSTAKHLGVHVNPRFGVFDSASEQVNAATPCPSAAVSSPSPRAPSDNSQPQPTSTPC